MSEAPNEPTEPTGPTGSVRRAHARRAASAPAGGISAPTEVTATVVPRRETAPSPAERTTPRSHESAPSAPAGPTATAALAGRPATAPAPDVRPEAILPTAAASPLAAATAADMPAPAAPAPPVAEVRAASASVSVTPEASAANQPGEDPPPRLAPGRRGPPALRLGQVVCWQLAAALIATSMGRATWIITAAVLTGFALVALTATWHRDLWTYQRGFLGLRQLSRDPRFVPVEAILRTIEVGETDAAVLVRPSGITVVLEVDTPSGTPDPARLLERHTDLESKLLVQRDRAWLALTAARTVGRHTDAELELLLANAVRRLTGPPHHPPASHRPLTSSELAEVLARLTPDRAREDWNGLRLWTGRYRMYAAPPDLAHPPAGAVVLTLLGELGQALVLAPAGARPEAGCVPLTGRQRSAFVAALP